MKYRFLSYWHFGDDIFGEWQGKDGKYVKRKLTKKEIKDLHIIPLVNPKPEDDLHHVWDLFLQKIKKFDKNGKYQGWKHTGWNLIEEAEKFAKKHPEHVRVVPCDDETHSSSALILIEHKCKNRYLGTSVVFVPQIANHDPVKFFLYQSTQTSMT